MVGVVSNTSEKITPIEDVMARLDVYLDGNLMVCICGNEKLSITFNGSISTVSCFKCDSVIMQAEEERITWKDIKLRK